MASQESIKLLGGNGGGFVAANSTSPNENPTALSNFVQLLAILLIPAALTYAFGRSVRDTRQGWALYAAMSLLFVAAFFVATPAELRGNPLIHQPGRPCPGMPWDRSSSSSACSAARPDDGIHPDHPFGGCRAPLRRGILFAMILLEVSVIVLSVLAFALFDLYTRACERI